MQNETIKTNKLRSFFLILTPAATVFISSFCVMALELVAGRLVAKGLGSSLYTWTAVIGVILAGITAGYYMGGRIADKFDAKKTLATLFVLSSASCVLTIILNNTVGEWLWPWYLDWPMHIFTYVMLVFLLPSTLLGMISPVVAKTALDKGLPQGRTVGDIYAWRSRQYIWNARRRFLSHPRDWNNTPDMDISRGTGALGHNLPGAIMGGVHLAGSIGTYVYYRGHADAMVPDGRQIFYAARTG